MKKIISLILTVMLIFAAMPMGVFTTSAATSGTTGACTWTLNGTSLTISGYGAMEDYSDVCPWGNSIKNLIIEGGITYIGANSFSGCKSLTSVSIPNSVTGIGNNAFDGCISLKKVYITSIAAWCGIDFYTYPSNPLCNGAGLYLNDELLTQITIPNSITNMMNYTFAAYDLLTSVTIPNGVTSIGRSVFDGCSFLENVTISDTVSTIGAYAFYNCGVLTTVNLGCGIAKISEGAFSGCNSITDVYYNSTEAQWNTIQIISNNKCLTDAEIHCTDAEVTVYDFEYDISNASSVIITGYKGNGGNVIIPYEIDGLPVTCIGSSAFDDCSSITSITIPDSVITINSAFNGCSMLTRISIPDSVVEIFGYSFYNCSSLKSVYITDMSDWCNIKFEEYASNPLCNGADLYLNNELVTDLIISNDIVSIGDYTFAGCNSITSLTISDGVRSIGRSAFDGCRSLADIEFPESDISIGDYVFNLCTSLTKISIPVNVTDMGIDVFGKCSSLTSVTLPDNMTIINDLTFSGCVSLAKIDIPESVTYIGDSAFRGCTSLTSITIPDNVTSIGYYAFESCKFLTDIIIGKGVTSISYDAFKYCNSLKNVYITDIVRWCNIDFQDYHYYNCSYYSNPLSYGGNLYLNNELVTNLIIPDSVTSIGSCAFSGCNSLTDITIGNGVMGIGNYAFYDCDSIVSITIPNNVTSIGDSTFASCDSLNTVTISVGVTSIGDNAFGACNSLTSISIPDSITFIGDEAFGSWNRIENLYISDIEAWFNIEFGVENNGTLNSSTNPMCFAENVYLNNQLLTDLYIPQDITIIDTYRFYGCKSIENVYIPKGLVLVKQDAFSNCTGIKNIYFEGTAEEWEEVAILSGNDYLYNAAVYYNSTDIPGGVTAVEITKLPDKLQYIQDEEPLDLTGGILTVYYSDGASQDIDLATLNVQGFNNYILGKQTLTVKYSDFILQFEVEIITKPITFMAVAILPLKIEYKAGEDLYLAGGKIAVGYPEGNYQLFDITADMVTGFNKHKIGTQVLAVNYKGYSAQLAVTVTPAVSVDFDGDGSVNIIDAALLRKEFLNSNISNNLTYDINGDKTTNAQDIVVLKKLLAEQI